MISEGLLIDWISGMCPVQAEGWMDGFPFYFRARHCGWTLTVSAPGTDPCDVFVDAHLDGKEVGIYHVSELYDDAGWMPHETAKHFIQREYENVCRRLSAELTPAVSP